MTKYIKRLFSPEMDNTGRNNNFNMIRFVAAIMVIYGHMSHIIGVPVLTVFNQDVSTIAVKIFFIISGYLIASSYMRDSNILRYSIRRFFRIIPGLLILTLLTVFVFGPLLTTLSVKEYFSAPETFLYLRNAILYPQYNLPGVFTNNIYPNAVNGSLWSLPVEVAMYILMPILLFIFKKLKIMKPGIIITVIAMILLDLVRMKYFPEARFIFYGSNVIDGLTLIPFFFIGCLFTFPEVKKLLNLQWAVALSAGGLLISLNYIKAEALLFIILPYLIFSFALEPRPIFGNFFTKHDYSFGLYLYGFLIQQILVLYLSKYNLSLNIYFVISVIVTFVFAFLSWHLVERPMQNLGKRLLKSKIISKL